MSKKKSEIKSFYYITHIDNLTSIAKNGILSHQRIEDLEIPFTPIYDTAIVSNRKNKRTPDGQSLWDFANSYFQPRNPMLFRVVHEKSANDIAVIGISPAIMSQTGTYVTTGNAANTDTEILPPAKGLKEIDWKIIESDWWNSVNGSKRKIMAECLVPDQIPPQFIHSVFVANPTVADKVKKAIPNTISVLVEPKMFFRPAKGWRITNRLSLAEGDMFFSNMQTLTISVNVVGIMGKGVASRAKYQFPDVYVTYQDACRKRLLRMGRPYLYKREASVDEELADEPRSLRYLNANKWFLLFATKKHWRDNADIHAIGEGVQWVRENYKSEGIKSLALPALGCGLGNLKWQDVGPVMCRDLAALDIDVVIYLPQEHQIDPEFLTPEHLLKSKRSADLSC